MRSLKPEASGWLNVLFPAGYNSRIAANESLKQKFGQAMYLKAFEGFKLSKATKAKDHTGIHHIITPNN